MNWELRNFGDIVQFPPKVHMIKGETYPFIPMDVLSSGVKYVAAEEEKEWKGSGGAKFENGDTLFARITPCLQNGKICQVKGLKGSKGFGSTEFFIYRGIEGVSDTDFIYYLSLTEEFRGYAIGSMVGASGRQRADATFVGKYEFLCPPLPIQKRIAEILSAYDDLIENNLKRIKLLEELAQRTYEEWFVKFRVNGEQLEIDKGTGLPVGWEKLRIATLCSFQNGYAYYTKGYSENGFTVLDLGNIGKNSDLITTGKEKYISPELYKSTEKFHLYKNDIVIAMTDVTSELGILGKTAIVDSDDKYVLNQRVGCLRPKVKTIDHYIIYALLNDRRFIQRMKSVSKGAVQFYFNTSDVLDYELTMPDQSFLERFKIIYVPLVELKQKLKDQNVKLKESRDILLPRLMNGTITVTP